MSDQIDFGLLTRAMEAGVGISLPSTDPATIFMACVLWRGPDGEHTYMESDCDGNRAIRIFGVHGLEDDCFTVVGDAAEDLATAAMTAIALYMEREW